MSLENRETSLFREDTCRLALDFSLVAGLLNNDRLFFLIGSEIGQTGVDRSSSRSVMN